MTIPRDPRSAGQRVNFSARTWNELQNHAIANLERGGDPRATPGPPASTTPPRFTATSGVILCGNHGTDPFGAGEFAAVSSESYDPLEMVGGEAVWFGRSHPRVTKFRFPQDIANSGMCLERIEPGAAGRVAVRGVYRYTPLSPREYGAEAIDIDRAFPTPNGRLQMDIVGPHVVLWSAVRAGGATTRNASIDINAADPFRRHVRVLSSSGTTAGDVRYDYGDYAGRWRITGAIARTTVPNLPSLLIEPHPQEVPAECVMVIGQGVGDTRGELYAWLQRPTVQECQ